MARWIRWNNPTIKPPFGAQIDWSNPVTEDLICSHLLNEYSGLNLLNDLTFQGNTGAFYANGGTVYGWEKDGFHLDRLSYFKFPPFIRQDAPKWTILIEFLQEERNPDSQLGDSTLIQYTNGSGTTGRSVVYIDDYNTPTYKLASYITAAQKTSNTIIEVNTCYVASLVKEGANFYWYLNGRPDGSFSGTASFSDGNPLIGVHKALGAGFKGWVYKFLWWSRNLSSTEIEQLYYEPYSFFLYPQYWYLVDLGGGTYKEYTIQYDIANKKEATISYDIQNKTEKSISYNILNKKEYNIDYNILTTKTYNILYDLLTNKEYNIVWDNLSKKEQTIIYDILAKKEYISSYNILNKKEYDLLYDILSSKGYTVIYDILATGAIEYTIIYDILNKKETQIKYDILTKKDYTINYNILNSLEKILKYDILTTTEKNIIYGILNKKEKTIIYNILNSKEVNIVYDILSKKEYTALWDILGLKEYLIKYDINSDIVIQPRYVFYPDKLTTIMTADKLTTIITLDD